MSKPTMIRTSSDHRNCNAERNIGEREVVRRVVNAYSVGHQEATNETVKLTGSSGGEAVLRALLHGDAKPYRAAMRNERRKIV